MDEDSKISAIADSLVVDNIQQDGSQVENVNLSDSRPDQIIEKSSSVVELTGDNSTVRLQSLAEESDLQVNGQQSDTEQKASMQSGKNEDNNIDFGASFESNEVEEKPHAVNYFYSNEEDDLSFDSPSKEESDHDETDSAETHSRDRLMVEMDFENADDDTSVESESKIMQKNFAREQLIAKYKQALMKHKISKEANIQLQTKLAEYFRRKKADAAEQSATSSIAGSNNDLSIDYEQRYQKYIASLTELRRQYQQMQSSYQQQIEELKSTCAVKQEEVDAAYKDFTTYKFNVGKKAVHSRTGKTINHKELLAMLNAEQKKEANVMEVRLENIKLRNELAKVEAALKSKEELADGLHLIDFEQLKIENQTYNEKIEERNEELTKLRRKISSTVQIMTHVKEKLQAIQYDNEKQRDRLGVAEHELSFNRDQLNKLKQTRDQLRTENVKLKRSCGLLGKNALLLNFEDAVDAVSEKTRVLENTQRLTMHYRLKTREISKKLGAESQD